MTASVKITEVYRVKSKLRMSEIGYTSRMIPGLYCTNKIKIIRSVNPLTERDQKF